MWISEARLTNFRNYEDLVLPLTNTVYFIVGKNGQGKTNILEAIGLISFTKSFRNADMRDVIQREQDFLRLSFSLQKENNNFSLEEYVGKTQNDVVERSFWKDKVQTSLDGFVAALKVVVFSPENINLLLLGPSERRKYLNFLLLQNFPQKFKILGRYNTVVANRNALLYQVKKGYADPKELEFWDARLVTEGSEIITLRETLIAKLNENFQKFFQDISSSKAQAKVFYKKNVAKEVFQEVLASTKNFDVEKATTNTGPHRDDLVIEIDGKDILTFGSRGELRTALLALKFAECEMFEQEERPVLLLDDVFSELDASRREKVLELSRRFQTFITTCELEDLPKSREGTKLLLVHKGEVKDA